MPWRRRRSRSSRSPPAGGRRGGARGSIRRWCGAVNERVTRRGTGRPGPQGECDMSLLGAVREILLILIPIVLLALINDFGGGSGLQAGFQAGKQAKNQAGDQAGPREAAR